MYVVNDHVVDNSEGGVWTPQGQKLGVSGHRGHQWIVAYALINDCANQTVVCF